MNIDHRLMKTGKKPPVAWPLKMATYLRDDILPAPPAAVTNSRGISDWGMMMNDTLGCCVIAAGFHSLQSLIMSEIDAVVPKELIGVIHPSDDLILRYYEQWAGYVFGDSSTDQGMDITTRLNNWRNQKLAGYNLLGFADPDPKNTLHIKQSIALFGGVDIGVQLPVEWQNAPVWDVVDGATPGSWGGHDVWVVDYNATGPVCVTWGSLQQFTWAGFAWACDEAHTIVQNNFRPVPGFDLAALKNDLSLIAA